MRRLLRGASRLATAGPLLVLLTLGIGWAFSYPAGWGLQLRTASNEWRVWGRRGMMHVDRVPLADWDRGKGQTVPLWFRPDPDADPDLDPYNDGATGGRWPVEFCFAGIRIATGEHGVNDSPWRYKPYWSVGVPFPLAAWLAAVPLMVRAVVRSRRRARRRVGFCARCGYDLRATPEVSEALLDRCPECGTVPSQARPAPK